MSILKSLEHQLSLTSPIKKNTFKIKNFEVVKKSEPSKLKLISVILEVQGEEEEECVQEKTRKIFDVTAKVISDAKFIAGYADKKFIKREKLIQGIIKVLNEDKDEKDKIKENADIRILTRGREMEYEKFSMEMFNCCGKVHLIVEE